MIVKEPVQDLVVLHSTAATVIEKADDIQCSSTKIPDLVIKSYNLPALSIKLQKYFICCKCSNSFLSTNSTALLECTHCLNKILQSAAKYYYQGNMTVQDKNYQHTDIMIYRHQFSAYYKMLGMVLPNNEDDVVLSFLSDHNHKVLCNSRKTCIGFDKKH